MIEFKAVIGQEEAVGAVDFGDVGKSALLILRAGAAAGLTAFVGVFLAITSLLTKPGERLGMPGVGKVK